MPVTLADTEQASERALLLEEIRQPITEDQPAGEDVTYDDRFRQLKAEVDESTTVSGRIDHEKALEGGRGSIFSEEESSYAAIVERSREILRSTSKDLRVASYLAVGLHHTRGLRGLAEGALLLHLLIEVYWEDLYPPKERARARAASVEFWVRRSGDALAQCRPTVQDRAPLEEARAGVEALQALLNSVMQERAPLLSGLATTLEGLLRRVPETAAPSEAAPEPSASGLPSTEQAASSARAEPAGAQHAPQGAPRSVPEAEHLAFRAAAFLRAQDATAAVSYRLCRVLRWEALRVAPPSEDRTTQVQAPPAPRRAYLAGLLEKGQYATLLEEAEASFREPPFHFWLDLQRFTAAGLDALGAPYRDARDAVRYEAARLIQRLPGLPALCFSDGMPFADPLTMDWIEEQATLVRGASDPADHAAPAPDGAANLEDQYRQARRQLGAGDLSGALAVLQDGEKEDASQRARFRRRLYLATLCVKGGQPAIACPVLEGLDEEADRHALGAWDPVLTLELWTTLYQCYESLSGSSAQPEKQTIRARAARIFEKVCQLDAGYALSLAEKESGRSA